MTTPERQKRIAEFESLLNFQLKTELQKVQDERDQLYERISHCMELRNNMTMLQDQKRTSLKTMVNLGCDFYVQAKMCAHAYTAHAPRTHRATPPTHRLCVRARAGQTRHVVGVRQRRAGLPRADDARGGDRV